MDAIGAFCRSKLLGSKHGENTKDFLPLDVNSPRETRTWKSRRWESTIPDGSWEVGFSVHGLEDNSEAVEHQYILHMEQKRNTEMNQEKKFGSSSRPELGSVQTRENSKASRFDFFSPRY